mmetsp:Transcript_5921/g.9859  ORF Transcript_5921/g.9859 Transcript_5921/m.9859 type:complete len:111 (+) Transcript_5921:94-426(+)
MKRRIEKQSISSKKRDAPTTDTTRLGSRICCQVVGGCETLKSLIIGMLLCIMLVGCNCPHYLTRKVNAEPAPQTSRSPPTSEARLVVPDICEKGNAKASSEFQTIYRKGH